jgi:peptidoglycan/xylan/chitin deacetylase (PgdA/CDA1 family)
LIGRTNTHLRVSEDRDLRSRGIRRSRRVVTAAGKWVGSRVAVALNVGLGDRSRGAVGILLYHRTVTPPPGIENPDVNVAPAGLRRQIEGLLRAGFRFWPLATAIQRTREQQAIPPKVAVLTFDDGYESVFLDAWPILHGLQVPATVFVATAYVGHDSPFPFDRWGTAHGRVAPPRSWRPLSWDQCRVMEESGLIQIGSHSHTHADFRGRPEAFGEDLTTSLAALDHHLGPGERPFAFPYGSVARGFADDALTELARAAGVTCALTTEIELADPRSTPFRWGRLEVMSSDSARMLRAKLEGWYGWMSSGKRMFHAVREAILP